MFYVYEQIDPYLDAAKLNLKKPSLVCVCSAAKELFVSNQVAYSAIQCMICLINRDARFVEKIKRKSFFDNPQNKSLFVSLLI